MQRIADVGVDVSKQELVIAIDGQPNKRAVIENQASAIQQWLSGLPAGSRIAMESTGRYHGLLAMLGQNLGFMVYVLNAQDVSHYAKALGARGKTDRTDAEMIACYIAEHHGRLHSYQPGTEVQQRIDALLRRRATVAMHRQAIMEALHDVSEIRQETDLLQARFETLIGAIDRQLQTQIEADEQMAVPFRRLNTITGFGLQTSAMLVSLFTRIPFANADALVAFSGLDPRPLDSGQKRGKRRLSKRGPASLRRLLFLAALSASKSKAIRPLYEAIRARGFSTTAAHVILARKLLRVAYAVWKTGQPFDVSRLLPTQPCT